MTFKEFILQEREQDEEYRSQAISIANRIIDAINKTNEKYVGKGIAYDFVSRKFSLGEFIPEYPRLKLKFLNQPNFGKNTDLGHQSGDTIGIALPSRTYQSATAQVYDWNNPGKFRTDRKFINSTVAKFLSKPQNYDTLIHEIIHFIDGKRTKEKAFKGYPYGDVGSAYYNHPSEYNAFLQAFLSRLQRTGVPSTWGQIENLLEKEDWFIILDEPLRKKALIRAYQWFSHPNRTLQLSLPSV